MVKSQRSRADLLEPSTYDKEAVPVQCPQCQSRQMVEISLSVSGERVTLKSCSSCDLRWWEGYDGQVPLAQLLQLAARER